MLAGYDSVGQGFTKSYYSPNLLDSERTQEALAKYGKKMGTLIREDWTAKQSGLQATTEEYRETAKEVQADRDRIQAERDQLQAEYEQMRTELHRVHGAMTGINA